MSFDSPPGAIDERPDRRRPVTLAELEARLAPLERPGSAAAYPVDDVAPPRRRRRWWPWLLMLLAVFVAWLAITTPLGRALEPLPAPAMLLMSADGQPIARRGSIKEAPVTVAELPRYVPMAFVSIEDRRFYSHLGIDPKGIARAAWVNLRAGSVREGGSTITQQLAKTAFLSADQNMVRKLREVLIAGWLEAWLTKDEILGRYMSSIYFGDGVYGLRAAARHYFGREPEQLSIAQAAMLAGVVKAPSRLAPTNDLKRARTRANLVEAAMVRSGAITQRQADLARPAAILRRRSDLPTGTYFADWVWPQARRAAEADYGEVKVPTTLDAKLQKLAVQIIGRAPLGGAQAALVAMRPNGEVVAMVGGRSYKASRFNRATQAKRQPGSTFKLFVYLAALRAGMSPDSEIEDRPVTIAGWSPKNYEGSYRGTISLRDAFALSSNVAAVRLQERVGRDAVTRAARDLGIKSQLTEQPSLALGTSTTSLLEMTAAYAAVSEGRYPVRPRGVPENADGRAWYDLGGFTRGRIGRRESQGLRELMRAAINRGTARAARLTIPAFGKTGTTQDHRDAMFIGFAGDLVVGVWVGNDDNSPMKGVTGGGVPARIWRAFMQSALGVEGGLRPGGGGQGAAPGLPGLPPVLTRGGDVVISDEVEEVERSAAEIERATRRLGTEDGGVEDVATVVREGGRIIERATTEPDEPEPEPEPEE